MTCANMKSANALSLLISIKSPLFCGFVCRRRHTPRTNDATVEMNPERNELNGKVPTKQQ